ncbi:MAG: septum formation initiator family protein [Treponema sp.]|jgi:cell division protein FtsB|nr:septum formation initiator family protein [Treponema sp.]
MRAFKYLFALWTAFAVYGISSTLTGVMGFSSYRKLETERDKQRANMENLRLINEKLENTKNSLLYDRDTIAVQARKLGYGRDDEKFVRIVGLGGIKSPDTAAGRLVTAEKPEAVPDRTLKTLAFSTGAAIFALFLAFDLLRLKRPG